MTVSSAHPVNVNPITLANDRYLLEFEPLHGGLVRFCDKAGGIELIGEPRLAEAFRLLIPLPGTQDNYLSSRDQTLTKVETNDQGMRLVWEGPLTNTNGAFAVKVIQEVGFEGMAVHMKMHVENGTSHEIAEVWHGGLGGISGYGPRQETESVFPAAYGETVNVFGYFPDTNVGALAGLRFPEYALGYPLELSMPWCALQNKIRGRSLYYACHDALPRIVFLHTELHPGFVRHRQPSNWPTDEEIEPMRDVYPAGLVSHWINLPFLKPGRTFSSGAVVLESLAGDWHMAARRYRDWFTAHFPLPSPRRPDGWLRRQHAVQDTMLLSPEGMIYHRIADIPQLARDALAHNVETIMISGWWVGGHDRGYPQYEPDPRLGTWDELRQAVAECHAIGVKVLFFANIHPVDVNTTWYERELQTYRVMNRNGNSSIYGWGYSTFSARRFYTRPDLVDCNPAHPAFRAIVVDAMRKLAEIGADGIHLDKVCVMTMDFNPALPYGPDEALPTGILQCLDDIQRACRAVKSDFAISLESSWDRLLTYSDNWWNWQDLPEHRPSLKYAFPEYLPTFAIIHPWDYRNTNNAFRYGSQFLIGPIRWVSSLADPQMRPIADYLREAIRLRKELADILFTGDFLDNREVTVASGVTIKYNTHRDPHSGRRACVLINQSSTPAEAAVTFDGPARTLRLYRPFAVPQPVKAGEVFTIPGERLAIVTEE